MAGKGVRDGAWGPPAVVFPRGLFGQFMSGWSIFGPVPDRYTQQFLRLFSFRFQSSNRQAGLYLSRGEPPAS